MSMQTPAQIRASKAEEIKNRLAGIKTRAAETKEKIAAARQATTATTSTQGGGNVQEVPTDVGGTFIASDGKAFATQEQLDSYEARLRSGKSAWSILTDEFTKYGLQSLIPGIEKIIKGGLSADEIKMEVRNLPEYKTRFSALDKRRARGLSAISEAEYLNLEDQYANTMRQYGLPESYYKRPNAVSPVPAFEQLIEFDVSPVELEDRIMSGQKRLIQAPPEVLRTIKDFYGNVINDGDVLAYVLNPKNAIEDIRRKITAAEIGAGAAQAGLATGVQRAEELARFGITGEQARSGFQTVAGIAPRGSQLASFYKEEPLTQSQIESEVFGTTGAVEAKKRREKLVGREIASFSGSAGTTQGALSRERAGQF